VALGVFHCGAQNFDAIGGTADIDWPPAPIASEAFDPKETLHVQCKPLSGCRSEIDYPAIVLSLAVTGCSSIT
jgi:hypothetical protein